MVTKPFAWIAYQAQYFMAFSSPQIGYKAYHFSWISEIIKFLLFLATLASKREQFIHTDIIQPTPQPHFIPNPNQLIRTSTWTPVMLRVNFQDHINSTDMHQYVFPTHIKGHTLDLVIRNCIAEFTTLTLIALSKILLTCKYGTIQLPISLH